MPYDIDEEIDVGDPDHVTHHTALAQAVNDLDTRVATEVDARVLLDARVEVLEDAPGGGGGVNTGFFGSWTIADMAPGPALPEGDGLALFMAAGPSMGLVFRLVDANGTDFSEVIQALPIASRVRVVSKANPTNEVILELNSGSNYGNSDGWGSGVGTIISGDVGTLSVGTEVFITFDASLGGGGGGETPNLQDVLDEGNTANAAITLGSGSVELILAGSGINQNDGERVFSTTPGGWGVGYLEGPVADGDSQVSIYGEGGKIIFTQDKRVGGTVNMDTMYLQLEELETGEAERTLLIPDRSGTLATTDQLPIVMTAAAYALITPDPDRLYIIQG